MSPHIIFPKYSFSLFPFLLAFVVLFSSTGHAIEFTLEEVFKFGTLAARDGQYEKAVDFFKKVTEMNPKFAPAYNALGLVYESWDEGGGTEEAVRYFNLAVDIDPSYIESWNNLGRALYTLGNFVQAERAFKRSLTLKPEQPEIELALGWVYLLGQSRAEESIDYFERALSKTDNDMGHYGLGLANLLKGPSGRFRVLEQITELRRRHKEEQAVKLETMIRENIQITSTPGTPLITGKEKLESLFEKELAALGRSVDVGQDGKGIQVRLRGPLH
jgi:tetratricopeptide (TPR) repeat protein